MPIRVILADDHAIVLNGLKRLFDSDSDFAVIACCRDGDEALRAVQSQDADVLVLDMPMPGRSGLEVLRELERGPVALPHRAPHGGDQRRGHRSKPSSSAPRDSC